MKSLMTRESYILDYCCLLIYKMYHPLNSFSAPIKIWSNEYLLESCTKNQLISGNRYYFIQTSLFSYREGILDYSRSITLDAHWNAIVLYIWKIGPVDARSAMETGLNRHQGVLFLTWVSKSCSLYLRFRLDSRKPHALLVLRCFFPGTGQLSACTRSIYRHYRYSLLSGGPGPSGSL